MVYFTPQQAAFALELLSQLAGIPATVVQSPLKYWDQLLKPNVERDWKHREEGQGEGMCVHLLFLRPECSYLLPAPSFTFSTEFLILGVFLVIVILEFIVTEKLV